MHGARRSVRPGGKGRPRVEPVFGVRRDQPCRAAFDRSRSAIAAVPERKAATCHEVSAVDLITVPPVLNSAAAASICQRARAVEALNARPA